MASDTHTDEALAHDRRRRHRRRRRVSSPTTARDRVDAWWFVGFAGVAAGFAETSPAGLRLADVLLTGLFAALVSLAASRARRWSWLWISGVALAAAGGGPVWIGLAALAFLLAVLAILFERRTRVRGALVAGLAMQPLLHLPHEWFHGWSAIIVAVAVLPVLVSGYRRAHRTERRRARYGALAVFGLVVLAGAAYGAAGVLARSSLNAGVNDAEHALDLIRDGRTDEASAALEQAEDSFDKAETLLGGPLAAP